MTLDDCPAVLKVAEAAEVARVDSKSIRQAIHRGDLAAMASGRLIRVHRDALRAWVMGESTKNDRQRERPAVVGGRPQHGHPSAA